MATPEHVEILRNGSEAIIKWQEANPYENLNLDGADLRSFSLKATNLSGARLRHAVLEGVDLRECNLTDAVLPYASLKYAT